MSGTWRRSLGKGQSCISGSRLDTHETSIRPSGMYAVIVPPKSIASEKDIGAAMESKVVEVVGGKWWRVYPNAISAREMSSDYRRVNGYRRPQVPGSGLPVPTSAQTTPARCPSRVVGRRGCDKGEAGQEEMYLLLCPSESAVCLRRAAFVHDRSTARRKSSHDGNVLNLWYTPH